MKVEKKAVRSGILKLEKNVQITLDEDMNVPEYPAGCGKDYREPGRGTY